VRDAETDVLRAVAFSLGASIRHRGPCVPGRTQVGVAVRAASSLPWLSIVIHGH
jgi:hypothetical protein